MLQQGRLQEKRRTVLPKTMTTKRGDLVRICFNAWVTSRKTIPASLSNCKYRVVRVLRNGKVWARSHPKAISLLLTSWVRLIE